MTMKDDVETLLHCQLNAVDVAEAWLGDDEATLARALDQAHSYETLASGCASVLGLVVRADADSRGVSVEDYMSELRLALTERAAEWLSR